MIVLGLLLGACSRNTDPLPRARDINILFIGSPAEEEFIRGQIEDFQRFNWNAKIRFHARPSHFSMVAELKQMQDRGQPVDLLYFDIRELSALVDTHKLLKLSSESQMRDLLSEMLAPLVSALEIDGSAYALPVSWSTQVLIYHPGIFDKIGMSYPSEFWGWPDVLEAVMASTIDMNRDGTPDQSGLQLRGQADELITMFWQFDGVLDGKAKEPGQRLTSENRVVMDETMDFYADMEKEMKVAVIGRGQWSKTRFAQGNAAVTFGQWSDMIELQEIDAAQDSPCRWQIAPVPRGKIRATLLEAKVLAIPVSSDRQVEAKALAQFLIRPDAQKALLENGVGLPVLTSLWPRVLDEGERRKLRMEAFYEQLADAQIAPPNSFMALLQGELDERIKSGKKTVSEANATPSFSNRLKLRIDPPPK